MARKDDFDLDDLDMDFGSDFDMKPVKRTGAIDEIKYQLKRKKGELFSNPLNYLKKVIKYSVPDEVNKLYETAKEDYDVNVAKLLKRKSEASSTTRDLLSIRKSFQNTAISSKLDKLYSAFYGDEEQDSAYKYVQKTQDQLNEESINSTLDGIFNSSKASTQGIIENQRDIAGLSETLRTKRHEESVTFYGSMARSLETSNQFSFNVTERYYKKSLEIQLKSYFALSSIAKTTSNTFEMQKVQLDAIIKNTSLPDISKMSIAKQAKKTLYESLANSGVEKLKGSKTIVGRLMKPFTEESSAESMVGTMAGMLGILGDDVSIEDVIVDLVEEKGIEFLSKPVKDFLTNKLKDSKNPKIKQIIKAVKNPTEIRKLTNPGINKARSWLAGKSETYQNKGGVTGDVMGNVVDKLSLLVDKFDDYVTTSTMENKAYVNLISGKRLSVEDLQEGVHYDVASRKSIVEVIPRYLSLIHQELKTIRTGKLQEELGYNYRDSKFTSIKGINKASLNEIKNASTGGLSSRLSEELIGSSRTKNYTYNDENYYKHVDKAFKMTLDENNGRYEGNSLSAKAEQYLKDNLPADIFKMVVRDLKRKDKEHSKDEKHKEKIEDMMDNKEENKFYTASRITKTLEDIFSSNPYAKEMLVKKGLIQEDRSSIDLENFLKSLANVHDDEDESDSTVNGFNPNRSKKPRTKPKTRSRVYSSGNTAILEQTNLKVVGVSDIVTNTQNIYELLKEGLTITKLPELNINSKANATDYVNPNTATNTTTNNTASLNTEELSKLLDEKLDNIFLKPRSAFNKVKEVSKSGYRKGKKIVGSSYKKAKKAGNYVYDNAKDFFGNLDYKGMYENTKGFVGNTYNSVKNKLGKGVDKILGVYHGVEDVYVKGELTPRILKLLMARGDYYFDQINNTPISNVSQIKGSVIDKDGNVVLSVDDLKTGIVDKNGNEFSSLGIKAKDLIKGLLIKGIEKGLPVVKNLLTLAKDKGLDVFNYMKSKIPGVFTFLKNVLEVPFSFFGSFRTGNVISSKVHNRLVEIRDLLNVRMQGKKQSFSEGTMEVDEKGEIKSSLSDGVGKVNNAINKVNEVLGKERKKGDEDASLAEKVGDTINNAKETITDIKDTITDKNKREEFKNKTKGKLKDTYEKLTGKKKKSKSEIHTEMTEEHREETIRAQETAKNIDAYAQDPNQKKSIIKWFRNLRRKPVDLKLLDRYQNKRTADEVSDGPAPAPATDANKEPKGKKSILGQLLGLVGGIAVGLAKLTGGVLKLLFNSGTIIDVAKAILFLLPGGKLLLKGAKWLGRTTKTVFDKVKGPVGKALSKTGEVIRAGAKKVGEKIFTRMAARAALTTAADVAGEAALGTGAAAAAGGAATAGATAAEVGTAGFLGLTPAGWVILGVGAAVVGGYFAYKYFTRDNVNDIDKLRYYQYGLGKNYTNKYHLIKSLEDIFIKAKVISNGVVDYYKVRAHAKEVSKLFDIDMNNTAHIKRFNTWLVNRFFPILIQHNNAYSTIDKNINVTNTDNLPKNKIGEVLLNVKVDTKLLEQRSSPFKDEEVLVTYSKEIIDLYNKMLLENKIDKSKLQDIKTNIVSKAAEFHQMDTTSISKDEKEKVVENVDAKLKTANNTAIVHNSSNMLNFYTKLDASDYGRGMAYGLKDYDKVRMVTIYKLEQIMTDYVVIKSNTVTVDIPEDMIYKRVAPYFGITVKNADSSNPWFKWFKDRFLPMFSTYVGVVYNYTGKYKPSTFITGISNEIKFQYLTALKGMVEQWKVTSTPWLDYELGTDANILNSIIKYYTPSDTTDRQIKSQVDNKLNTKTRPTGDKVKQDVENNNSPVSKPTEYDSKGYGAEDLPITTGTTINLRDSKDVGNAALADKYIETNGNVDFSGVNPTLLKLFRSMVAEYGEKTGKKVHVNSAFRSPEQQAKLRAMYGRRAAAPGHSMHGLGLAIDINSTDANAMAQMGLFQKYGFGRPVANEAWHIEPNAFDGLREQVKKDPNIATNLIYKSLTSDVYNKVFADGTTSVNTQSLAFKGNVPTNVTPTPLAFKTDVKAGINPAASSGETNTNDPTNISPANNVASGFGNDIPPASQLVGANKNYGSIDTSNMKKLIEDVSTMTQTDKDLNLTIASMESSLNPNAISSTGATGLYQFTEGTWSDLVKKYGKTYGIDSNTPRTDPKANATLGALYIKEHSASMGNTKDPVFIEAAHMAPAYAPKFYELYNSAPQTSASEVFSSKTIKNNMGMFAPNGRVLTLGELYTNIQAKLSTATKGAGITYKKPTDTNKTPEQLQKDSRTITLADVPNNKSKLNIASNNIPVTKVGEATSQLYDRNVTPTSLPAVAPNNTGMAPKPVTSFNIPNNKVVEQPNNIISELSPNIEKMVTILDKSLDTQLKMLERLINIDGKTGGNNAAASNTSSANNIPAETNPIPKNKNDSVKFPDSSIDIKRSVI